MANPSVPAQNQPTGSGTEIVKRAWAQSIDNNTTTVLITGVDGHLYTILSLFVNNTHASETGEFIVRIFTDGSGYPYVMRKQAVGPLEGFVCADRFVLTNTDQLQIYAASGDGEFGAYVSYIDQDWS